MITRDFTIKGKTYRIRFDPAEHTYTLLDDEGTPKRRLISVTAAFSLPPWAIPWAAKAVVQEAEDNYGLVLDDEQRKALKKAPIAIRDAAGDIGTNVHTMIHNYMTGNFNGLVDPRPEVMRRLKNWTAWYQDSGFEYVASERMIYNRNPEYVGTCDHIFRDPRTGLLHTADTKSGKSIKPEGFLQCAAYQNAYCIETDTDPKQFGKRIQIHALKTKCTAYESTLPFHIDLRAYKAALYYWKYLNGGIT